MIFDVRHKTSYGYGSPVSVAQHLLHVEPRDLPHQRRLRSAVEIVPAPARRFAGVDYFGNRTLFLTIDRPHCELVIEARSRVEVSRPAPPEAGTTPPWEEIVACLASPSSHTVLEALEFCYPTPQTPILADCLTYARRSFTPGRPILAAALDLTHRINSDFRYDTTATHTHTPLAQAFALRRGVCQDFAHIQIACLRALGLPVRYVSGYLLTRPAPGRERLVGADASHAWVSIWLGAQGWIDLDPTNDLVVGDQHVSLAIGRDYNDVAPVSGVIYGGGKHRIAVAVDVVPIGGT